MISVLTPTIRPEGLPMVAKCLNRQDVEFEWIIVAPSRIINDICDLKLDAIILTEPPKKEDDFYCLNKAWNLAYSKARGQLIVNIVDWIWFPPDTLERLWNHYLANPKACITAIGHQYDKVENDKPEGLMWSDPRSRLDQGTFYQVAPSEMEMCVASLPRQAILDCGGLDENYDKGAAIGEKEMCWRLARLGYQFYIDQTIEYRALHHGRLSPKWDEYYKITSAMFVKHMQQMELGQRTLKLGYVK
jgi:hypothetical protein